MKSPFPGMDPFIEDRGLSRIFRQAIESDTDAPSIPFSEVKRQLATQRRKTNKRRS